MKLKRHLINQEFSLTNQNIEKSVRLIAELPEDDFEGGLNKKAVLLRVEEALLIYQDYFGKDKKFKLFLHKMFGKYTLRIAVSGEYFNPLENMPDDVYMQHFTQVLSSYGSRFEHSYNSGKNNISLTFKKKAKINDILKLLISIVAGVVIGCIGAALPETIKEYPLQILDNLKNIIMGLISFVALPVVFLSVIDGITSSGSLQNLGQRGTKTIKKFLFVSLIVTIFTLISSCILFPLNFEMGNSSKSIFDTLLSLIVGIFPNNIAKPFVEGNMLQVILIGIVIGCAILVLEEKTENSLSPLNKISNIFSTVMQWFSKFIPIALSCMIAVNFMDGSFTKMLKSWPVYIAMIVLSGIVIFVTAIIVSKKLGITFDYLIKTIINPMIIGLSTASAVTAFNDMKKSLKDSLKVDSGYVSFALPMAISFFAVGATLEQLLIMLFVTHMSGIGVSIAWIFSLLLLNFVFAIAAPPVSGGSIAVMTIMMQTQGIPENLYSTAFIAVTLLEYVSTSLRIGMIIMVSAGEAKKMKLINK